MEANRRGRRIVKLWDYDKLQRVILKRWRIV
nr:MAG TPA: Protein DBF4, BRCT, Rad53, replication checkpoint.4A [Bacteriophage sp.]